MLPDDVYRSRMAATFAEVQRVVRALSDVAIVSARDETSRHRLTLQPSARGACPIELMVRIDQRYDIEIGSEFYEDCEVAEFSDFAALVQAVAEGDVVTRHTFSAATGSLRSVETVVRLPGGRRWSLGHVIAPGGSSADDADTIVKDRTFLPYRR